MGYAQKQAERCTQVATIRTPDRGEKMFRELTVNYKEGGVNYWNYSTINRGFYLTSSIVKIEGQMKTWTAGQTGDGYTLLEEAKRFNAKRLQALADNATKFSEQINTMLEKPVEGYVDYIIRVVCFGSEK